MKIVLFYVYNIKTLLNLMYAKQIYLIYIKILSQISKMYFFLNILAFSSIKNHLFNFYRLKNIKHIYIIKY